jgi:hypothetical protein
MTPPQNATPALLRRDLFCMHVAAAHIWTLQPMSDACNAYTPSALRSAAAGERLLRSQTERPSLAMPPRAASPPSKAKGAAAKDAAPAGPTIDELVRLRRCLGCSFRALVPPFSVSRFADALHLRFPCGAESAG